MHICHICLARTGISNSKQQACDPRKHDLVVTHMAVMTLTMTMIIMMTMMMMPAMYGDGMVTMAMMVVMMAVAPWLHLGAPGPDYDVLWVWAHGAERPPQTFTNSTASDVELQHPSSTMFVAHAPASLFRNGCSLPTTSGVVKTLRHAISLLLSNPAVVVWKDTVL